MKYLQFFRLLLVFSLATSIAGCAALSDKWTVKTVVATASGEAPEKYAETIKAHFENSLKDPFSAQYRNFTAPKKYVNETTVTTQSPTLINVNGYATKTLTHCWLVTVDVNAKNSYGAYIGWKTHVFLFRGESIISTHAR
jgi:hypothetical protein